MASGLGHEREAALDRAQALAESAIEGRSVAISAFRRLLLGAARTDVPVLLLGETGTGKTTFARALHALSPRAGRPFVRVDCRGRPGDLAEHARAARTGTLFLDEVSELAHDAQSSALALVQEAYARPGHPPVRVLTSAHPDLEAKVAARRFRPDLYYRLSVFEALIPPLRDRAEDIVPLARRFVEAAAKREGRALLELPPEMERALLSYQWPGNVTELMSVIERVLILAPGGTLDVAALPPRMRT